MQNDTKDGWGSKLKKNILNIAVAAIALGCCVALYFIGNRQVDVTPDPSIEPTVSDANADASKALEGFAQRLESNCRDCTLNRQSLRDYELTYDICTVLLHTELSKDSVSGVLLTCTLPPPPKEAEPSDATGYAAYIADTAILERTLQLLTDFCTACTETLTNSTIAQIDMSVLTEFMGSAFSDTKGSVTLSSGVNIAFKITEFSSVRQIQITIET